MGIPVELLSMLGGAATGFLFKAWSVAQQNKKEMFQMAMQKNEQQNKFMDAAAARTNDSYGKTTRRLITIFIMIMFLALIFMPLFDVKTVVESTPQTKSVLWGLIEWSSKIKYTEIGGYLLTNEMRQALLAIISFYYGQGAAKP